jgi:SAM-dependent methyltransferase
VSTTTEAFSQRSDYGNFDSNVLFIERTGVLAPGARILEIGSGKGRLLRHLLQRGCDIRGVEADTSSIAASRGLYGELPLSAVDTVALPETDGSLDIVLSFDVLEHIPDTDGHLREVRRVLKPGGWYLLQTPNKWTNALFETIRWKSLTAWKIEHCSLHSYGQIKRRFARHGFTVEFYDIPLVTDFFRLKVEAYLGKFGLLLLKAVNLDALPLALRTNFYIKARREGRVDPPG